MLSHWDIAHVAYPVEPVKELEDADQAGSSEEAQGPACRVHSTQDNQQIP